jgi:nucleoside-diphosphate-sugar epimerase
MVHLVTGGAGFLGSHLVDALIDDGHTVLIIDNLSTGHVRNLEHAISSGRATFIYGDVVAPVAALLELVRKAANARVERIFHLASPASPKAYGAKPWETLEVNGVGTMALVELALAEGARFLFASTSEIYGDPLVHPQPEGYFGNVDPIGPRSCYDEGKRFGEAVIATAVRSRGLDARIARFFNCYGPRMNEADGRLIPELFEAARLGRPLPIHGTGLQTRSMTYVADAVGMVRRLMELPQTELQPLNIGSDEERSVEQIARAVARVTGREFVADYLPPRPGDPQVRKPDLTLARAAGLAGSTPLDTGLRATLRWLSEDRLAYA